MFLAFVIKSWILNRDKLNILNDGNEISLLRDWSPNIFVRLVSSSKLTHEGLSEFELYKK